MQTALTFGIPLRSANDPDEWESICGLLRNTLRSVYNQKDGGFRIIIAADRAPALGALADRRLEILPVTLPAPNSHDEGDNDAGARRWHIAHRFLSRGGGQIMFLDADDLVKDELVGFVRQTNHPNGYVFETGYGLDIDTGRVLPIPQAGVTDAPFHQMCGSSVIVCLKPGDLTPEEGRPPRFNRLFRAGHTSVAAASIEECRPMLVVPFRAAVYVVGGPVSQSVIRAREDSGFGAGRQRWRARLAEDGFDVGEIAGAFGLTYRPPLWRRAVSRLRTGFRREAAGR